jgi:hypothetical protein
MYYAALRPEEALGPSQLRTTLARRPYDLRHAAVSTWLNAGVQAPQVAEWARHTVHVLMRVYTKCIYGQEEAARCRIEAALAHDPDDPTDGLWPTQSRLTVRRRCRHPGSSLGCLGDSIPIRNSQNLSTGREHRSRPVDSFLDT